MMNDNWRVTSDVVLIIENTSSGGNKVYIASPEKKQYEVAVSKLCKDYYTKRTVENSDFEIKIKDNGYGLPILNIRTSQLPELGWVEVGNFYTPSIWNILSQCKLDRGTFIDNFKIVFTETDPKVISIVSPNMIEYNEACEEMKRRLLCEFGKKTKLLKPGHRYDSLKETRYVLCKVVSRKLNSCNSDFQNDSITISNDAYIYTNAILDSDKYISDVLRNRKFGIGKYDLKIEILEKKTSWVDGGSKLTDDFTGNIKDYWEDIIDKTIEFGLSRVNDSNYYRYSNFASIFEVLSCQSLCDLTYNIEESLKDKLTNVISNNAEYTLLKRWNIRASNKSQELSDKNDVDVNVLALWSLLINSIEDGNIQKFSYYKELFNALGIDVNKVLFNLIISFNENDLTSTFDNFLKYKFFWTNKKSKYSRTVLDFNVSTLKETPEKIEDILGSGELSNTIKDLYNYARSNFGDGVKSFKVIKGDKKDKYNIIFCCIDLNDIIKFKKGVSEMSENLKCDIILNKFNSITICCKESEVL